MNRNLKLTTMIFWQYLNQKVCNARSVWDLERFWYLYQVQLFKNCWAKECSSKTNHY
jgi:hypothetical protein